MTAFRFLTAGESHGKGLTMIAAQGPIDLQAQAGQVRFRRLRGRELRPTMDRVREALFAVLANRVPGARFLDLYAGAGTVGLEALSR